MPVVKGAPPIISIRAVGKQYPGVRALDQISFDVARGELHSICGENGAGKSTLMKILSGVIPDFEGELLVCGRTANFRSAREAEQAGVSIIHQELNLVEELSAAANIFLGRELRNGLGLLAHRQMETAARALLRELECEIDPTALAGSLRVGDQQLLEIAKALSLQSEILIMDEPTSALTETEVERLYRVIERLRERGVTILYISHKMDEVFRLSDRITVLRDGRWVSTLERTETTPREITHLMVGREIESLQLSSHRQAGPTVMQVDHLSLPWPGHARKWRLKDVSFSLRQGEILGFAGLMGAGRTELFECLFGAAADRYEGRVLLNGQEVRFRHPAEATQAGVALVTEDRKRLGLFSQMNVRENITLCTLRQATLGPFLLGSKERQMATLMVDQLAVKTAGVSAAVTSLSGGNQQKCIIGRWLLTQPRVLLLDDPTRGIDVGAKAELYRLMNQLCDEGISIMLTSSELPELLTVADRILVLCEGRLTGEFSRAEATEQKIMEAATACGPLAATEQT
ncbi:sugar ABC transporter ATP-binding protein [Lignipirellula cremea]|uniref:Ribose import ATP-binding protein RbsA n=1 Tax=Lignipirellula cremea TaxID=2528010 RepID=A0A518DVX8_9BACT|nr:sugar ABC transporter ATP-binding protein [Lignipirellula cremea]QDU95991.1 Ribose import ATP-binding protein RbsA [Lignipirellula cremea]